MTSFFRPLIALTVIAFLFLPAAGIAAEKAADPCSFLTPAEIQEILGKPVKPGTPKISPSPAAGANCTYVVGDFGSFNILVRPLLAGENPERIKAEFAKMKMAPTDLPNLGDRSFFTSPGMGMVQLHTFKGSRFILFTLLVPGANEEAQKAAAEKLMRIVLSRIK